MEVEIKEFAYTNPAGGTNLSYDSRSIPFNGQAVVTVLAGVWDSETGWGYQGQASSEDLKAFISKHAHPDDQRVFFSEYDLVDSSLREAVAEEVIRRDREEFNSYMQRLKEAIEVQPKNTAAKFEGSSAVIYQDGVFYCARNSDDVPEYHNLLDPDISAWAADWKQELDAWFASPQFESISEEDRNKILSNFID
jgi:hypothetical protein